MFYDLLMFYLLLTLSKVEEEEKSLFLRMYRILWIFIIQNLKRKKKEDKTEKKTKTQEFLFFVFVLVLFYF